jgi:peroxiredoxin
MNPFSEFALGLLSLGMVGISWLGWQLLRQNGRLLLRLEELEKRLDGLEFGEDDQPTGLAVGSEAPAFELRDLAGEHRSLAQYRGNPLLLIFFNPACGFCRELLPKLKEKVESRKQKTEIKTGGDGAGNGGPPKEPAVLIISTGDIEVNRTLFAEFKVSCSVLLQKGSEVAQVYKANGTPSGYLIDAEGKIASGLSVGGDELLKVLEGNGESRKQKAEIEPGPSATVAGNGHERDNRFSQRSLGRSKIKRDGLKAGTPAPDFTLPRLDGRGELSLGELRGRRVLLVFSSPGCGPCNTLAPELEKVHRDHPELEVVMISKGEPKENRAKVKEHGLTFPVVLQQQWEISRRYAMFATPVAYLVDEQGVISHDVAVGVEPILALISPVAGAVEFAGDKRGSGLQGGTENGKE